MATTFCVPHDWPWRLTRISIFDIAASDTPPGQEGVFLILTPIRNKLVTFLHLLKDYARGGWASWLKFHSHETWAPLSEHNQRLQTRGNSAHMVGGLAIYHPVHPNRTKPLLTALLILSQLIVPVQSFGKLFSSRQLP